MQGVETVDLKAPGEGGGKYQTKATNLANSLSYDRDAIWWPTSRTASRSLMVWNRCVPVSSIAAMLLRGRASRSRIGIFHWGTA